MKPKKIKKNRGKPTRARSLERAIRENNELLREAIEKLDDNNYNSNMTRNNFHPMQRKQQNPLEELEES